jgi:hypothetical protein
MPDPLSDLGSQHGDESWDLLDDAIGRLEEAWRTAGDADLTQFLPPRGDPPRLWMLLRLIPVDRECREKYGHPMALEQYLAEWEELQARPDALAELRGAETTISLRRQENRGSAGTDDRLPREWQPGDVILDLYEVKEVLPPGGMGLVYRVHHRGWNVDLAVKCPKPEYYATQELKSLFVCECETWGNLGLHPHVVSCHYVRELDGIRRIFAEYVDGGNLQEWIKTRRLYEGGPEKALDRMLDVAIQVAHGLEYAHEKGIVHQDVKPANVMMTSKGSVKITDFGTCQPV